MTQLVKYEAARQALEAAHSVDEVKDIRDKAVAMQAYARQANDKEFLNWAAEIRLRAERRAGAMLQEMDKSKGGRPELTSTQTAPVNSAPTLAEIGVTKKQSSEWQKVAAVPEEDFETYIGETAADDKVPTATGVTSKNGNKAAIYTGNNEWYTPPEYIEAARTVMGKITTDPASNKIAQNTVNAKFWYDEKTDGLKQNWVGEVFLNPPYAHPAISHFIDKLCNEFKDGNVTEAILLTNNSTDTKWWHQSASFASGICFTEGRIKFRNEAGDKNSPVNGQTFFYYGNNFYKFADEFNQFGLVLRA